MAELPREVIAGLTFGDGGVQLGINGTVRMGLRCGQSGCPTDMTFTEEPRGVRLRWGSSGGGNVLVTWSHIRQVEYAQAKPEKSPTAQK